MKKQDYSTPEVRVIIGPGQGVGRKKKGKYAKNHFAKKKKAFRPLPLLLTIFVVVIIIAAIIVLAFFFPKINPLSTDDEENITPIPSIEITNHAMDSSDSVTVDVDSPVVFSAINSSDKDGTIKQYLWDFGDGNKDSGVIVKHTYLAPDTYTVNLEIIDDKDDSASTQLIVLVNSPPIAIITLDTKTVPIDANLPLSASDSIDPDWPGPGSGISKYYWEFGDGHTAYGVNTNHSYSTIGNFTITLSVWDTYNSHDSTSDTVEIELRTFAVSWALENNSVLNRYGFTRENETTSLSTNITDYDLHLVSIKLNWTDFLPLMNITDDDPDEFRLSITTPSGQLKSLNSTSEVILIEFLNINVREDYLVHAESLSAATEEVNKKTPQSNAEVGEWKIDITAVNCPGGILLEENEFFSDIGNSWHIDAVYYYYTVEIIEV